MVNDFEKKGEINVQKKKVADQLKNTESMNLFGFV